MVKDIDKNQIIQLFILTKNQAEVARVMDISRQRVNQIIKEKIGVSKKKPKFKKLEKSYIDYLKESDYPEWRKRAYIKNFKENGNIKAEESI